MSKTLGSIITIAGAIVVNVVPGLGQLGSAAILAGSAVLGSIVSRLDNGGQPSPTQSTAIKTERPPAVSQYGRGKLFGAYICYETSSGGTAVDVYAFHEGQIDGIEDWYLGDKKVVRGSDGFVQPGEDGAYGTGVIQIGANLGLPIETAHAPVIAKLPGKWTTNHRGDGVVTGYMLSNPVKSKDYQKIYPAGGPDRTPLAIVFRGQLVYDWRDSTQSATDPKTWKWSENSWLHIAHYKLVREAVGPTRPPSDPAYWSDIAALYGARWARLFAPSLAFWTAAANDAELGVPLKAGGTEPRYRSCVSHKHAGDGSEHKAVLASLLATCDGWIAARQDGALIARPGRYYTPTVSIGPDHIIGYTVEAGVEDENALNQINVSYVSSLHDFNVVETDPWVDEDEILARGAVRSTDFAPQSPSHAQNRRLAKRKMAQTMAPKRGTFTLLSTGAAVLGERFVDALFAEGVGTEDEFIAYDGPIEITQLTRNLRTGVISGTWIAADVNIDAWNPATEEGDPAPVGERVAREPLAAPTITTATVNLTADAGAGAPGAFIRLVVAAPNRTDLAWSARTRIVGSAVWGEREYTDLDASASVTIDTEFVPTDAMVEAQVAYQTGDGRISPWSASKVVDTSTAALDVDYDGGNAMGNAS